MRLGPKTARRFSAVQFRHASISFSAPPSRNLCLRSACRFRPRLEDRGGSRRYRRPDQLSLCELATARRRDPGQPLRHLCDADLLLYARQARLAGGRIKVARMQWLLRTGDRFGKAHRTCPLQLVAVETSSETEGASVRTQCTVCLHTRRAEIEAALAGETPLREIARQFGVSKDSARRHRVRHMRDIADPLTVEIGPCPVHGATSFRFEKGTWVCGLCSPWDGDLAYWRHAAETEAGCGVQT